MTFKEVGNELPEIWKPEKEGDFIVGIYKQKKERVGKNNSNLYVLDQGQKLMSVWGSTVLDDLMVCHANIGDKIKITYRGEDEEKNYKKFKLEIDDGEESIETIKPSEF